MNEHDARAYAAADHRVFIFCDAASHAPRRVAVTNFARIRGSWHEVPASRANTSGYTGTGRTIVGDTLPAPGWANNALEDDAVVRDRHELQCRKCTGQPVPVRAERHLTRVLDTLAGAGVSEVSLRGLAARLKPLGQ